MTTKIINDAESMARQQLLLTWLETIASDLAIRAGGELRHGHSACAMNMAIDVTRLRNIAQKVRARLVDISELTLADVQADEPPAPLVDLTEWLRGKLGHYFPYMASEHWQAIAFVLRPFRRVRP